MGVASIPSLISTRSLFSTHISAITPISTGTYKPVSTVYRDNFCDSVLIHEEKQNLIPLMVFRYSGNSVFPRYDGIYALRSDL